MALRKLVDVSGSDKAPALEGGQWSSRWPTVLEFLEAVAWEDGSRRVPGSLTLFCEDGSLKACLSDKDSNRVAFVSARGPEACLDAAEAGLAGGGLDWRLSKGRPQPGRR